MSFVSCAVSLPIYASFLVGQCPEREVSCIGVLTKTKDDDGRVMFEWDPRHIWIWTSGPRHRSPAFAWVVGFEGALHVLPGEGAGC